MASTKIGSPKDNLRQLITEQGTVVTINGVRRKVLVTNLPVGKRKPDARYITDTQPILTGHVMDMDGTKWLVTSDAPTSRAGGVYKVIAQHAPNLLKVVLGKRDVVQLWSYPEDSSLEIVGGIMKYFEGKLSMITSDTEDSRRITKGRRFIKFDAAWTISELDRKTIPGLLIIHADLDAFNDFDSIEDELASFFTYHGPDEHGNPLPPVTGVVSDEPWSQEGFHWLMDYWSRTTRWWVHYGSQFGTPHDAYEYPPYAFVPLPGGGCIIDQRPNAIPILLIPGSGHQLRFHTEVNGSRDGGTPTWWSDNRSIATVDSHGYVTAVGEGIVTVTALYQGTGRGFEIRVSQPNSYSFRDTSNHALPPIVTAGSDVTLWKTDSTGIPVQQIYIYWDIDLNGHSPLDTKLHVNLFQGTSGGNVGPSARIDYGQPGFMPPLEGYNPDPAYLLAYYDMSAEPVRLPITCEWTEIVWAAPPPGGFLP